MCGWVYMGGCLYQLIIGGSRELAVPGAAEPASSDDQLIEAHLPTKYPLLHMKNEILV